MIHLKLKHLKAFTLSCIDKLRVIFANYFIAQSSDNKEVRKKHKRVGGAIGVTLVVVLIGAIFLSDAIDSGIFTRDESRKEIANTSTKVDIRNLSNGASHEQTWIERAEQEMLDLKTQAQTAQEKQDKLDEYLNEESVSKKDLVKILKDLERGISEKYESRIENMLLDQQALNAGNVNAKLSQGSAIEVIKNNKIKVVKKIGTYIPAGSYVEAKMISGVDAGIGITAEADPRQVLLRIVGKAISAGFGKDYLSTNNLMGCVVQCQAIGDLSSEKAYLKPVVMTCAKSTDTVIEIPVKGYVTSNGKVGIRGEIVSREGDLVAKSFLSGLIGGIGGGISQVYEPGYSLSGGFAVKQTGSDVAKNVLGAGLGKGVNESSNRLSDYLIKRAEQYQPVISINEGVSVDLVFQEGFSINEEVHENAE